MSVPSERAPASYVLHTFVVQATALGLPLATSYFWLTGPHPWRESLQWACALLPLCWLDGRAPSRRGRAQALQLHALFFLQLLNHALSLLTASMLRIDTPAALAQTGATLLPTIALGSAASACSIRWTGRELLQRRSAVERTMGRILLACALCEPAALEQRASANAARLRETDQLRQRGVRRGPRARWTKAAAEQLGRPLLLLFIACVFGSFALSVFAVQALATQLLLERVLRAGERRARAALAEAPAASSAGAAGGG